MQPPGSRIIYPTRPPPKGRVSRQSRQVLIGIAIVLALAGGFTYLSWSPFFRVGPIEVRGATWVHTADLEAELTKRLGGTRLGVLPADHLAVLSSEALEHALRERFPELEAVDVGKRLPNRLTVDIRERQLWGVYCQAAERGDPATGCSYVDAAGIAFGRFSAVQGRILPIVYGANSVTLGETVVEPRLITFYQEASKALSSLGVVPISLRMGTTSATDVRLTLAEGWEAWVSRDGSVDAWRDLLKTVLEKEIGSRRADLEYVDIRFGNRVFYKFRE